MQPSNPRRCMVESCKVDLHAEYAPHKREQPWVFTPGALDEDTDGLRVGLPDADDPGLSHVTERPEVFSVWREHIHPVRRQSPQGIDGEVESVGRPDSNGVAVVGVSIRRPGKRGAACTTRAASAAPVHNANAELSREIIQW